MITLSIVNLFTVTIKGGAIEKSGKYAIERNPYNYDGGSH
jgi:hypothetical protein